MRDVNLTKVRVRQSPMSGRKKMPVGLSFDDSVHNVETLARLNTMRKEGHFCDAILEVEGHSILVHRAILASCSKHLFELFSAVDEGRIQKPHFKLDNMDFNSVNILVNYAYTSRLECDAALVKSVYKTATQLKMDRVAQQCSLYLVENLTVENCLGTRAFASRYCDHELISKVDDYIQQNLQAVTERSLEFAKLPCIFVDIVGVESADLSSNGEQPLCKLVVDWLDVAVQERPLELLVEDTNILHLTSDNKLQDCLEDLSDMSLNNCDIIKDYKKLARRRQILPVNGSKEKNGRHGSRSPTSSPTIKSGMENPYESCCEVIASKVVADKSFMCISTLDKNLVGVSIKFRSEESVLKRSSSCELTPSPPNDAKASTEKQCLMTALAPMTSARCGLGTAVLDDRLIALGGYDRGECLSSVEAYDLTSNSWSPLKPMHRPRGRFAAAQINGKLVACGGCDGHDELGSVESYNPLPGLWSNLPEMNFPRSSSGIAVCDEKLYIVGGLSGSGSLAKCEVFDPAKNSWNTIADLNISRSQAAVCAIGNSAVVAVGGCDTWNIINSVEIYKPDTDVWTCLPSMAVARRGAGVAFFNNKLYVIGGSDGQTSLVSVEIYDMANHSWSFGPSLSTPRANMGVAVMNGRLFAVGGFSGKAFLKSIEYLSADGEEWCGYLPAVSRSRNQLFKDEKSETSSNNGQLLLEKENGFHPIPTSNEDHHESHSNGTNISNGHCSNGSNNGEIAAVDDETSALFAAHDS